MFNKYVWGILSRTNVLFLKSAFTGEKVGFHDITLPLELAERFCAAVFMGPFLAVSVELS